VKSKRRWVRVTTELVVGLIAASAAIWAIQTYDVRLSPVLSDSMSPTFVQGDAVISVGTQARTPVEGDVVVFEGLITQDLTMPVVHRWIATNPDGTLVTKGDGNPEADRFALTADDIEAVQVFTLPTHYFRQPWVVPVSGAVLGFVFFSYLILWVTGRNKKDEASDDAGSETPVHRVVKQLDVPASVAASTPKRKRRKSREVEPLDWYSGGEDWPNSPPRYPWLEPAVKVVAVQETKPDIPVPIIPSWWVPVVVKLPPDPADIYLAR
jgi:signal peptidase I